VKHLLTSCNRDSFRATVPVYPTPAGRAEAILASHVPPLPLRLPAQRQGHQPFANTDPTAGAPEVQSGSRTPKSNWIPVYEPLPQTRASKLIFSQRRGHRIVRTPRVHGQGSFSSPVPSLGTRGAQHDSRKHGGRSRVWLTSSFPF